MGVSLGLIRRASLGRGLEQLRQHLADVAIGGEYNFRPPNPSLYRRFSRDLVRRRRLHGLKPSGVAKPRSSLRTNVASRRRSKPQGWSFRVKPTVRW